MIGRTISHYKITEKLGEGGMGEVYLADDTRLKRKVALKFLSEFLHQDEIACKRFLREAQSAAALDHPFICKIYEAGEADGQSFIAMEYVKGQTLKEKLLEGPVSLEQTFQIGIEIAEALEEAHQAGIVHRDLKPANIMLTVGGHAKVMDFGLAKRVAASEGADHDITTMLTREGSTLGTLLYMSPEQLQGELVDTRSDIFSCGTIFYEILTGVHPFRKGVQIATTVAILHDAPAPLSHHLAGVPISLERLVAKMLEKDSSERYQDMSLVRSDLGRAREALDLAGLVRVTAAETVSLGQFAPSIAVLPFQDMSPDKDQDYFCEGIAEEIINALTHVESLRVAARTSAFSFRGKDADIREIGKKLGVSTVLEGSVRKADDQFRITAQLINVEDGYHIWSERFDRKMDNVFSIQDEISLNIFEKLKVSLAGEDKALIVKRYTRNTDAYLAYLRGRHQFQSMSDFEKAEEFLQEAIAIDAEYAPAYAMLANIYGNWIVWGGRPKREPLPLMKEAVEKALELEPSLAEARLAAAFLKGLERDWDAVDRESRRAVELNPALPEALVFRATVFFGCTGRLEESITVLKKALDLDPLSAWVHFWLGSMYFCARSNKEAIRHFKMSLQIDPGMGIAHWFLGLTFLEEDQTEKALEQLDAIGAGQHPYVLARIGKTDQALKTLETRRWDRLAQTFTALGRKDEAFAELEKAFFDPDTPICPEESGLKISPVWDPLHDDPRFKDLLYRMGLEP